MPNRLAKGALAGLALTSLLLAACASTPTPDYINQEYDDLKKGLNPDCAGDAIEKLSAFRDKYKTYAIAAAAADEIAALRRRVPAQYERARELARQDEFDRAEAMLADLAAHFPGTKEATLAGEYLRFDFPLFKAQRLLATGRAEEADAVLRALRARTQQPLQIQQIERARDVASHMRVAQNKSAENRLHAACRALQMLLAERYAKQAAYPSTLAYDDLKLGDPPREKRLRETIGAIEEYRSTREGYSLLAVAKDGRTKCRLTPERIELLGAAWSPGSSAGP
jgi:hypothetical protein